MIWSNKGDYVFTMEITRAWRSHGARSSILTSKSEKGEVVLPGGSYAELMKQQLYEFEFGKFVLVTYLINRKTGERTKIK